MFIVWGSKEKKKQLGFVADHCIQCQDVRAFSLEDRYEAGHIYYISLTQGKWRATVKTCLTCHGEFVASKNDYREFILDRNTRIDDLLRRSNPTLLEKIESRQRLESIAAQDPVAVPTLSNHLAGETTDNSYAASVAASQEQERIKAQLQLHINSLNEQEGAEEVPGFMQRLESWMQMDDGARAALGVEIETYCKEQKDVDQAVVFIRRIASSFPSNSGCFVAVIIMLLFLSAFIWAPVVQSWLWGSLVVVAGLVASVVVLGQLSAKGTRKWVKTKLVPQADRDGVNLTLFIQLLAGIAQSGTKVDDDVESLVGGIDDIHATLFELGRLES